jgi:Flp pilus assembly protein TadB
MKKSLDKEDIKKENKNNLNRKFFIIIISLLILTCIVSLIMKAWTLAAFFAIITLIETIFFLKGWRVFWF